MNLYFEFAKAGLWIVGSICFVGFAVILLFMTNKSGKMLIVVIGTILSIGAATFFMQQAAKGMLFAIQFNNTKNNLDVNSLIIIANGSHGLPFATLDKLDINAIRYLEALRVIDAEVFPETLNYTYYLTKLGRSLLKEDLRYKLLYPESFCDMYLLRFYQLDRYQKGRDQKESEYDKKYRISWKRSWSIFCDLFKRQFGEAGLEIKEKEITSKFESYVKEKGFTFILNEIIGPWQKQIDKEKNKHFRLFL